MATFPDVSDNSPAQNETITEGFMIDYKAIAARIRDERKLHKGLS